MSSKIIAKNEWLGALQGLQNSYRVFVPVKEGDFHIFKSLDEARTFDFQYENTRLSPKALVYPQSERILECNLDDKEADAHLFRESDKEYTPQAVVGLRPCDAQAFQIVKLNFDNPEFRDPWWVRRFESTTLIGMGCTNPCATCFCTSVDGGPFDEKYLDAILYDLGEDLLVKGITPKGDAFLEKLDGGAPSEPQRLQEADTLARSSENKVSSSISADKLASKRINDLFDADFWEEIAFGCLNCGTCTFLCPTCWCFDIQDEVTGQIGDRIRNWDSCMFPLFTMHGSGHNPREEKVQRVRQRFMHKLKYYVDKYGNGIQCSGCGRCVRYCPVNIDIRKVCELMNDN